MESNKRRLSAIRLCWESEDKKWLVEALTKGSGSLVGENL